MPAANGSPNVDLKQITVTIMAMLGQYWTSDESPGSAKAIIKQRLDDVGEFTAEIVEEACREWRQGRNGVAVRSRATSACFASKRKRIGR
jgi:hypothetical protein